MGPQEDYIETVFTCEGDYDDPHLQDRLDDFTKNLKDLLLTDKSKLILKKVEPWNSVRVTFNIPRDAAVRLKQLAQQGNARLKDLGVLAVQIQDQHISLTIAGRNNEHAQLVFRTAEPSVATMPTVSMFDTTSPSLDEIGPQGPGPSYAETASRNIADYLRQGLDSLLNQSGDKSFPPGVPGNGHKGKRNNIIQPSLDHGSGKHKSFPPPPLPTSQHGSLPRTSASVNATSPRRSPVGQGGREFQQLPGMPPGLPPGLPSGPRHSLDNLPPPPPYPQGSSIVNNFQKLRFATDTNPLLVNLLHQHDPNFSSLLQAGLLPPGLDAESLQQPQKKKRKPRKPKEKKKNNEIEVPTSTGGISNPLGSLQIPVTVPFNVTTVQSSLTTTSFVNREVVATVKERLVQNSSQALHNMKVQNNPDRIMPLTSPSMVCKRIEESDTAGKIINPVTGLLEPMDNLSDTSPTKSESGKHSPRYVGQKVNKNTSEVVSTSPLKVDSVLSRQGTHPSLYPSIQRTLSEHSMTMGPAVLGLSHKALNSSHPGGTLPSDMLQHKQLNEVLNKEFVVKSQVKNDIMPRFDKLEQKLLDRQIEPSRTLENECDTFSAPGVSTAKVEQRIMVGLPQESDIKTIPSQLLNKPLLQVKHTDSTVSGGKPSGSPDSNGDSECSSQSINLDTQNGADLGSQTGPPLDPRSYNNDSGVGSSSERSDDTPSEPGDSDFKSGNSSSFECAKTPVLDPLKQTPPTSKVVTVGFAINETQKNHKIVSPFISSDRTLNSKYDLTKLKSEKTELCSPSQLHGLPWTTVDDQIRGTNIVDSYVKQVVQESIIRKSPKLASTGLNARLSSVDGQINSMQGIPPEQSMQKKKSSPRNSPRGSPRNPGSPRNTNSPRGGGSPRSTDTGMSVNSRQSYLTAQEFAAHLPLRESHNKSPYSDPGKSSHNEQRKSPFNFLLTSHPSVTGISKTNPSGNHLMNNDLRREIQHSVGVDSLRLSSQCNIDNIALLKSLEAAHGSATLPGKEASIMQKFEELRPYFQKLQQQAAQATAAPVPVRNGTEVLNHLSRSPGSMGPLNKHGPSTNMDDLHSAFEMSIPNNLHPSVSISTSSDRENTLVNCVNSKGNKEEHKGANNSTGSRRSPGAATSNSVSSYPNDSSLLPPPKRLTESVQKLFPNPLDNSLPHNIINRRSPISSASVTRVSSTTSGSMSVTNSRVSVSSVSVRSSGSKTPVNDLDLDSITPSITGFGFGPADLQIDTSLKSQISLSLNDTISMPKLMMMDSSSSKLSHQSVVSTSAVKVVPAVVGSIASHKAYAIDSVPRGSPQLVSSNGSYSISSAGSVTTSLASVTSENKTYLCNSDNKMASVRVSTTESILNSHRNSPTFGPPLLHPQTVKYPKSVEKPKSPYQQMGLSEMLQETANLQSISAGRAASPVSNISVNQRVPQHSTINKVLDQDKELVTSVSLVEKIQLAIDTQVCESNSHTVSETKPSSSASVSDSQGTPKDNLHGDNLDIPKLKCQINVGSTGMLSKSESSNGGSHYKDTSEKNCGNHSKSAESPNLLTSKDPSPPILTAVVNVSECEKENISKEPDKVLNQIENKTNCSIQSSAISLTHVPVQVQEPKTVDSVSESQTTLSTLVTQSRNLPAVADHIYPTSDNVNSVGGDHEHSGLNLRASKLRKRRGSSESIEEKPDEPGVAPRQLRSRKRTGESENVMEDPKRLKLDLNSEITASYKVESAKDSKVSQSVKTSVQTVTNIESKVGDDINTQDSLGSKGGMRTRTNIKSVTVDEKGKPPSGRESRKDGKVISNKSIPDKKTEQSKVDEAKRTQQNRRNRQSPSAPTDKLLTNAAPREKSPLRISRSRGHSSPVVVENSEETQENKRKTRSAKSKGDPVAQSSSKSGTVNKRRRTSQDHR